MLQHLQAPEQVKKVTANDNSLLCALLPACLLPCVLVGFFPHSTVWQIILPHSQQKTGCGESLCSAPRAIHVIRVGLTSPDLAEGSRVGAIGAPAPIAEFGWCQGQCTWHRTPKQLCNPVPSHTDSYRVPFLCSHCLAETANAATKGNHGKKTLDTAPLSKTIGQSQK